MHKITDDQAQMQTIMYYMPWREKLVVGVWQLFNQKRYKRWEEYINDGKSGHYAYLCTLASSRMELKRKF